MTAQDGFSTYDIQRLAPTVVAQFDSAPATWALKHIFGVRGEVKPAMYRGDAVEAGLGRYLHNHGHTDVARRKDILGHAIEHALAVFWDRAQGEITDETEKEAGLIIGMVEHGAAYFDQFNSGLEFTQLTVETNIDGVGVPIWGKVDFILADGSIHELKTTTRVPSALETATLSHRWQAAVYAKSRNATTHLVYVSAKKFNSFEVLPDDQSLVSLAQSARAMERQLRAQPKGVDLLNRLPLVHGSFYWDERFIEAYEAAQTEKLIAIKGNGAENLGALGYITFGKHAGKHIESVPESYLDWLLNPKLSSGDVFDVPSDLQDAIREARRISA